MLNTTVKNSKTYEKLLKLQEKNIAFQPMTQVLGIDYQIILANLFPNPADGLVFPDLESWRGKAKMLTFCDQLNGKVLEKRYAETSALVEVLDLPEIDNGNYFLKIETLGERAVFEIRIVLKKH